MESRGGLVDAVDFYLVRYFDVDAQPGKLRQGFRSQTSELEPNILE